jgi:DNA processing protein
MREGPLEVAVSEAAAAICKTSENTMQWLAMALTPGLGPTKARRVIEFFGGVQAVFRASLTELEAAGIRAISAQSLGTGRSMELAQDELGKAAAAGVSVVALDDPAYPSQLKQIYDPPLILYVRGKVETISQPGIALVGTRHPTPYGSGMAERLACDLAARGLVIFSGMARGVDTAGHRGAIAGNYPLTSR